MAAPKKSRPISVKGVIRLHVYNIIADAVESGVRWGLVHATEHEPIAEMTEAAVDVISRDVLCTLGDIIDWSDGEA